MQCPERQPTRQSGAPRSSSVLHSRQGTRQGRGEQQGAGPAGIKPPGSRTSRKPTRENPRCKCRRPHARTPSSSAVARPLAGRTDGRLRCVGEWRARAERQAASRQDAGTRRYARPTRRDAREGAVEPSRSQCNDGIGGHVAIGRAARRGLPRPAVRFVQPVQQTGATGPLDLRVARAGHTSLASLARETGDHPADSICRVFARKKRIERGRAGQ